MPAHPARIMRLTQAERTKRSDRRMIESAIQLIVENGISAMKLTDVGRKAGYSRGLATMRFGTKAGLLSRVARHVTVNWVARVTASVAGKRGIPAVLAAIDAQERAMIETPSEVRAVYVIFFQSSDPNAEYRADVARMLTAQRRDLANWFRQARNIGEISPRAHAPRIAAQVLSSMLGIVYQWIMDPDVSAHELHRGLKEVLLERVAVRTSPRTRRRGAAAR
jgi:AcrR family transcriptional regulator